MVCDACRGRAPRQGQQLNDYFSSSQVVRKSVVATRSGVVAAQHRRAAEVGAAVLENGGDAIDAAYREGGVFQLTMHPHISGYRSRIWILDELIQHMRSQGKVWFATHADVVRHAKANG